MSRKLLIKDADFSTNGIRNIGVQLEPVLGIDMTALTHASSTTSNYYFPRPSYQMPLIAGRTIYGIQVRTVSNGNFNVLKMTGYSTDPVVGETNTGEITRVGSFTGVAGQVITHYFNTPVEIPAEGGVCFAVYPDGTALYFLDATEPILFYLSSKTGAWKITTASGGGFELLALVE